MKALCRWNEFAYASNSGLQPASTLLGSSAPWCCLVVQTMHRCVCYACCIVILVLTQAVGRQERVAGYPPVPAALGVRAH